MVNTILSPTILGPTVLGPTVLSPSLAERLEELRTDRRVGQEDRQGLAGV